MKTGRGAICLVHAALILFGDSSCPARNRGLRKFAGAQPVEEPPVPEGCPIRSTAGSAPLRPTAPQSAGTEPYAPTPESAKRSRLRPSPRRPRPKRRTAVSSITPTALFSRKLYDLAVPEYEKYPGQYPGAPGRASAYFYLAECYRALNRSVRRPAASFQSVLDNYADSEFAGPASYGVAEILFTQKDFAGALPLFHRAAAKSKEPALALSARYFEARCLENLDRKDEAQTLYQQVADTKNPNPYREDARMAAGTIALARGRKTDAFRNYEALANETQKPALKAEATVRAGMVAIDLQQTEKGKVDKAMLEKALSLLQKGRSLPEAGRWRAIARGGIAAAAISIGQYAKVLAEYKRGQKEIPGGSARGNDAASWGTVIASSARPRRRMMFISKIIAKYPNREEAKDAQYQRLINFYNTNAPTLLAEIDAVPEIKSHAGARRPGEAAQGRTFLQGTEVCRGGADLRGAARLAALAEAARRGRLQTRLVLCAVEGWTARH